MLAAASSNSGSTQRRSSIHLQVLLERAHGTAIAALDSPTSTSLLSRTRLSRSGLKHSSGSKCLTCSIEPTWLPPAAPAEAFLLTLAKLSVLLTDYASVAVLGSRRIPSATSLALRGSVPGKSSTCSWR